MTTKVKNERKQKTNGICVDNNAEFHCDENTLDYTLILINNT